MANQSMHQIELGVSLETREDLMFSDPKQIIQTNDPQLPPSFFRYFWAKPHTKKRPTTRWERLEFDSLHASPLQLYKGLRSRKGGAVALAAPPLGEGRPSAPANQEPMGLHILSPSILLVEFGWIFCFHFSIRSSFFDKQTRSRPLRSPTFFSNLCEKQKKHLMAPN